MKCYEHHPRLVKEVVEKKWFDDFTLKTLSNIFFFLDRFISTRPSPIRLFRRESDSKLAIRLQDFGRQKRLRRNTRNDFVYCIVSLPI
jgi:hypothetical protein